jgi:hypothetical protein
MKDSAATLAPSDQIGMRWTCTVRYAFTIGS